MKTVLIEGMMCERCAKHVLDALEKIGDNVTVNLAQSKATLNTDKNNHEITTVIEQAGYEVKEIING